MKRGWRIRETRGLTLVELVLTLGVFSVLTLFLADLMGQPQAVITGTLQKYTGLQNTQVQLTLLESHLKESGVLKSGLLRCNDMNIAPLDDDPAFRTDSNCATGVGTRKDCAVLNFGTESTPPSESEKFTIPFRTMSEIAAKKSGSLDELLVENTASFPVGSIVAVSHLRSSAEGAFYRVKEVVANTSVKLEALSDTTAETERPRMPADVRCAFPEKKPLETLTSQVDGVKLFGTRPIIFRMERIQFATYQYFGGSLVASILETMDSEGAVQSRQEVMVKDHFRFLKIGFRWSADDPSAALDSRAEVAVQSRTQGEMRIFYKLRREEYLKLIAQSGRSLASDQGGKIDRDFLGETKFSYRSGAGLNFTVSTAPVNPRPFVPDCSRSLTRLKYDNDIDPGIVAPPVDQANLYEVSASGSLADPGARVEVSFSLPSGETRTHGRTARCWLLNPTIPGAGIPNKSFNFDGPDEAHKFITSFRSDAGADIVGSTLPSVRLSVDPYDPVRPWAKRRYICEIPPATTVAAKVSVFKSTCISPPPGYTVTAADRAVCISGTEKAVYTVETGTCGDPSPTPEFFTVLWPAGNTFWCEKSTGILSTSSPGLDRVDGIGSILTPSPSIGLSPASCEWKDKVTNVVSTSDCGAHPASDLLSVTFSPGFPSTDTSPGTTYDPTKEMYQHQFPPASAGGHGAGKTNFVRQGGRLLVQTTCE